MPFVCAFGKDSILLSIRGGGYYHRRKIFHGKNVKTNQHPKTLECFQKLIDYSGLELIQPLVEVKDADEVASEIGDREIIDHANDTKCILSGNLNSYSIDEIALQKFLDEYVYRIGAYIIDDFRAGKSISCKAVDNLIEGLF